MHLPDVPGVTRPSELMRAAGIAQRGAGVLAAPAGLFDLPRQGSVARAVLVQLLRTMEVVKELHNFSKGVGLAAPQLALPWSAAVVKPVDGELIVLLNPEVVGASPGVDERYEGCLSFFDFRGLVPRYLWVDVASTRLDGSRMVERYERATARLVQHEIDHLAGRLYVDRMPAGAELVPVDEYRGAGQPWNYGADTAA